jgi:hypothetical protein
VRAGRSPGEAGAPRRPDRRCLSPGVGVAIEQVSGVLLGRSGSFVVHHTGTMAGGVDRLSIAIVADSGTEELTGISGTMTLQVVDGGHRYELLYSLPQ